MKIEIVKEKYSNEIIQLFIEEYKNLNAFNYQDRSPNFFNLYKTFKSDKATYIIGRDHSGTLVFCYGLIPYQTQVGYKLPIMYGSDLYIHPNLRNTKNAWKYVKASVPYFIQALGNNLLWMVEQTPGILTALEKIINASNLNFKYIGITIAKEIYLKELNTNISNSKFLNIDQLLTSFSEDNILSFINSEMREFVPCLGVESLKCISSLSNKSFYYVYEENGQIKGILILADLEKARKLIYTGKFSPLLNHIKSGQTIKYAICDIFGKIDLNINDIVGFSKKSNYDVLNIRDSSIDYTQIDPKYILNYSRRVCILHQSELSYWSDCFNSFEKGMRMKLHSLFL
ncbi:MAG: hypothetical protein KDD58_12040 [Bdellovibrionales bacterium]|nr:hypothetical protein [Bdellovibrionales bacterium]